MGIVVTPHFDRGGVYYAGETLRCTLTFSYARDALSHSAVNSAGRPSAPPATSVTRSRNLSQLSVAAAWPTGRSSRTTSLAATSPREGSLSAVSARTSLESSYSAWPDEVGDGGDWTRGAIDYTPFGLPERSPGGPGPFLNHDDWPAVGTRSRTPSFPAPAPLADERMTDKITRDEGDPPTLSTELTPEPTKPETADTKLPTASSSTSLGGWLGLWDTPAVESATPTPVSAELVNSDTEPPPPATTTTPASQSGGGLWSRFPGMLRASSSERPNPVADLSMMNRSSSSPHAAARPRRLLCAFAQLEGTLSVDSAIVRTEQFESLRAIAMYPGAAPTTSAASAGTPTRHPATAAFHSRWPTFSTPPSLLFIDLALLPGQARQVTFEVRLPRELPPTFRGRAIRFSYALVLTSQHSALNRQPHVVQLPFHILPYVDGRGKSPLYDLLQPVIRLKDEASVAEVEKSELRPSSGQFDTIDLQHNDFLRDVIEEVHGQPSPPDEKNEGQGDLAAQALKSLVVPTESPDEGDTIVEHIEHVCRLRNQVRLHLRNAAGLSVALVTLPKDAFQIGETVRGEVQLLGTDGVACLHLSLWLESEEVVDDEFAVQSLGRCRTLTRRIHDERHEFCRYIRTVSFQLGCPASHTGTASAATQSLATAGFRSSVVRLQWSLRVEFIIGRNDQMSDKADVDPGPTIPEPPAAKVHPALPLMESLTMAYQQRVLSTTAVTEVPAETLTCTVPLRMYPASRDLSFATETPVAVATTYTLPSF
ncbi:Golgi membrane exchange factor (Ric1p-Rgp1p) subunit [Tieghemiomyces parasiticus]|uniref:Golgi membrane exchange factor (Ric1p-Rgp1p) subunit n=1 Tax=Tieghemiomyces parasiticus TaxID=78921 RepID=A0A9W8AFY9_9FUNG|nr:Golgi membrane exchange factor (Ric1p-Rgp1p) subunit [Tieghemiomyces parasiticus]